MDEVRIFRYVLNDAFDIMETQVDIVDKGDKGEVRCIEWENPSAFSDIVNTVTDFQIIIIQKKVIDFIKSIMCNYMEVMEYEEIEFPLVLDGYTNSFELSLAPEISNRISASNLSAFAEGSNVYITEGEKPYPLSDSG